MKKFISTRILNAFTLVELLVVLGIICILASLMVAAYSYMGRMALEAKTRAEVKALEAALEAYKRDNGGYPPLDWNAMNGVPGVEGCIVSDTVGMGKGKGVWAHMGGDGGSGKGTPRVETNAASGWYNSQFLVRALGTNNPNKVYYEFKEKQMMQIKKVTAGCVPTTSLECTFLLDPMGNPYGYNPINPYFNPSSFDLWSCGTSGRNYYPNKYSISNENIGNWEK